MALRKDTNPREMDLQPGLQEILLRNGMQAHIVADGSGYRLLVQGCLLYTSPSPRDS